jgi:hypothetical protein
MKEDTTDYEVVAHTFPDRPHVAVVTGMDPHYWHGFDSREKLDAFITELNTAADKVFGPQP